MDKVCFCGGHLKFSQMMASVWALLCDETEAKDHGRQSRLFFPGGLGLPDAFALFQPPAAPTITVAPATTTTAAASTAATTTALEARAQLLENNINSLEEAKTAIEKAAVPARRRKRAAAATTCSEFISLVEKRETFLRLHHKVHGNNAL